MKTSAMRAVSDADVIIHLSKLEKLSLLQSLYTEVAIPDYIKEELKSSIFLSNEALAKVPLK